MKKICFIIALSLCMFSCDNPTTSETSVDNNITVPGTGDNVEDSGSEENSGAGGNVGDSGSGENSGADGNVEDSGTDDTPTTSYSIISTAAIDFTLTGIPADDAYEGFSDIVVTDGISMQDITCTPDTNNEDNDSEAVELAKLASVIESELQSGFAESPIANVNFSATTFSASGEHNAQEAIGILTLYANSGYRFENGTTSFEITLKLVLSDDVKTAGGIFVTL
ncbi:MAG: hypothetical protein R3Y36_06335 [Spirochaetales bacterium]